MAKGKKKTKSSTGKQNNYGITPSATRQVVHKFVQWGRPTADSSGAVWIIKIDGGSAYNYQYDRTAVHASGFELSDFFSATQRNHYDYFRILSVTYYATLVRGEPAADYVNGGHVNPPYVDAAVEVWYSVDLDDGSAPTNFASFFDRMNKNMVMLTPWQPHQKLCTFAPIRRISPNADSSLHIVPKPHEWCDMRNSSQIIFGNLKCGFVAVNGNIETPQITQTSYPVVKITAKITCEFKGVLS